MAGVPPDHHLAEDMERRQLFPQSRSLPAALKTQLLRLLDEPDVQRAVALAA
jgi:hypothetical protein